MVFWKNFYESFEKNFLNHSELEYFVFTDAYELYGEKNNDRIHRIYQENLGWPGNTLFRFRMFVGIKKWLQGFDYLFFINANTVCLKEVTEEEFLPVEQDLLVVQHPGYYRCKTRKMPYEHREESSACIPRGQGKHYVYGAINGGKTAAFLRMAEKLNNDIEKDYAQGIIAKWHDESHLNYYVWSEGNYRLLSPAYAYPENYNLPFEKKIIILDKSKMIELDRNKLQELKDRSIRGRIAKFFTRKLS